MTGLMATTGPTKTAGKVEAGTLAGDIPFIRGGTGSKHAVVFYGGNALLRRLDKTKSPERYARQVARALPPDWRFTILGYPEFPPAGYTLDTVAADFARAIPAETGVPDLVIGVSFGGFAALRFAALHPDLVRRLVILVSAHRFSDEGRRRVADQIRALEQGDVYRVAMENAPLFRRPWYNWAMRAGLRLGRNRLAAMIKDPAVILAAYRTLFSDDFDRNLSFAARVRAPTLLIGGTRDQYFDVAALRETVAAIPAGRLALIEGERHMLPLERGPAIAAAIADFLGEDVNAS